MRKRRMNSLRGKMIKYIAAPASLVWAVSSAALYFMLPKEYFIRTFAVISAVFAVSLISVLIFAVIAQKRIAKKVNSIDLNSPESCDIYDELSSLTEKISEKNAELCAKMENMRAEHEKQDAVRREFTADVSHELRTPLTSISGYAEIIKNGIAKDEDIERFAGKIYDESRRLITLTGDIIKLSQLDEKEVNVTSESIDLYELCGEVLSSLELSAKKRGISLSLNGERAEINGAEQIVEEMVFNVCDNAVKYNRENGSVNVNIRKCVDGVELTVSDTGIGIGKDDLPYIFDRFYRADKSHSKEIGGTGLGLSIVKHCAMFMGARLSVNSEPGKGTEVKILF